MTATYFADGTPLPPEPGTRPAEQFEHDVAAELTKLKVRDEARRRHASDKAEAAAEPFDVATLGEVLARPASPRARIDGLMPWESALLLIAQRKTGKTTLNLNWCRSLLSGEPYLGRFDVRPLDGDVVFLNYEVSGEQLARWARDTGVDPDRLHLVNLRGRRNPLSNPGDRDRLAVALKARGVEAVIVDPFGRAYSGASQNDAGEVTTWLTDLDRFVRSQVGARDLLLAAHAGWNGERSRGSSALEDWADSVVTVVRDPDDETVRYLRATGRDVDIDEDRLDYDPATRHLTLAGAGSRRKAAGDRKVKQLIPEVIAIVTHRPGINGTGVETELRGRSIPFQRGAERKALADAVQLGWLRIETQGAAKCYFPAATSPTDLPATSPTTEGPKQ